MPEYLSALVTAALVGFVVAAAVAEWYWNRAEVRFWQRVRSRLEKWKRETPAEVS